jgi:predicted amidohydrolase
MSTRQTRYDGEFKRTLVELYHNGKTQSALSDLSRNSGITPIGLPIDRMNWGNYDLVVIDDYDIIGLSQKTA